MEKPDEEKTLEECWEACQLETLSSVNQDLEHDCRGINDHQNCEMKRQKMISKLCRAFLQLSHLTSEKEGMKNLKVLDSNCSVLEDFIQKYKTVEQMQETVRVRAENSALAFGFQKKTPTCQGNIFAFYTYAIRSQLYKSRSLNVFQLKLVTIIR